MRLKTEHSPADRSMFEYNYVNADNPCVLPLFVPILLIKRLQNVVLNWLSVVSWWFGNELTMYVVSSSLPSTQMLLTCTRLATYLTSMCRQQQHSNLYMNIKSRAHPHAYSVVSRGDNDPCDTMCSCLCDS